MRNCIVTTTINSPTKATEEFCKIASRGKWLFIIVGDTKTPHDEYRALEAKYNTTYLESIIYLHPDQQEEMYPALSKAIGWKSIQRRNIGFVYAYEKGANIVATVDDDNIPYPHWGQHVFVGQEIFVDHYQTRSSEIFDPLSITNHPELWHRGYPIQDLEYKNDIMYMGKKPIRVMIQADLWDGDPDIDAMCRLTKKPMVKFPSTLAPYWSDSISPFNSQNTFIHREILPHYAVLPHVGRMDDIWGGYIAQNHLSAGEGVVYCRASVYQDRNQQDLVTNLENEVIGYRNTMDFILNLDNWETREYIPKETVKFWDEYTKLFKIHEDIGSNSIAQ